jgi:hypothetical protein
MNRPRPNWEAIMKDCRAELTIIAIFAMILVAVVYTVAFAH